MTNLEKNLMRGLIIGYRLSVLERMEVENLIKKANMEGTKEAENALKPLMSFSESTFPLAKLIQKNEVTMSDNVKRLAEMIHDFNYTEKQIIEFIESNM